MESNIYCMGKINYLRALNLLIVGIIGFTLTGCATILDRSTHDISINTEPSRATLHVLDKRGNVVASGVTPFTVRLKSGDGFFKRASYSLRFYKEGYEEVQYPLTTSINPNYFWNLFSWSALGLFLVDPATGAMWQFSGDSYTVSLTPKKGYFNDDHGRSVNTNNNSIIININKKDLE